MNKWDTRFINLALFVAQWSKDPSTKCGAVITRPDNRIVSVGFNGFPKHTSDEDALYNNREEKYRRVIHAEKNAILFAQGHNLSGCTMYVVPMPPCSQCAGMIIQVGIARVVTVKPSPEQFMRWRYDIHSTQRMFFEADVTMEYFKL